MKAKLFERVKAEFVNNKTIVWGGIAMPGGVWFQCKKCYKPKDMDLFSRLSLYEKFCGNCGTKLDWKNIKKIIDPKTKKVEISGW